MHQQPPRDAASLLDEQAAVADAAAELVTAAEQAMLWSQSGRAEQTLHEVGPLLEQAEASGDQDVVLRLHYARAVALHALGRHAACRDACTHMLVTAETAALAAWQSCALSLRAVAHIALGEPDAGLHDLVAAQVTLEAAGHAASDAGSGTASGADSELAADAEPDPVSAPAPTPVAGAARAPATLAHGYAITGLAIGFDLLRLYELALPHYEAALELDIASGGPEVPAVNRINLAEVHVRWALELDQVDQQESAVRHAAEAVEHAQAAHVLCRGLPGRWDAQARMLHGAALALAGDPRAAEALLEPATRQLAEGGFAPDAHLGQVLLARALTRRGELAQAAAVMRAAREQAPVGLPWHARAAALAESAQIEHEMQGSAPAAAGDYARLLARTLWGERQHLLRTAEAEIELHRLRAGFRSELPGHEDALTGLANRQGLDAALAVLTLERRLPAAALIIDLDDLASINDLAGHPRGDAVLRRTAGLLLDNAREGDAVARLDDDLFALLLPGAGLPQALRVAERALLAIRDHPWPATTAVPPVTASVGVAVAEHPGELEALLGRAERAMLAAQRAGGDGLRVAPPERAADS